MGRLGGCLQCLPWIAARPQDAAVEQPEIGNGGAPEVEPFLLLLGQCLVGPKGAAPVEEGSDMLIRI